MKQTIDSSLRNESQNWWTEIGLGKRSQLCAKYYNELPSESDIEFIYQQETNPKAIIGSGVDENNWKIVEWVEKRKTIYKIATQQDDLIADVVNKPDAKLICEAVNNYQALRDYSVYVESKIEIGEIPLTLDQWKEFNEYGNQ